MTTSYEVLCEIVDLFGGPGGWALACQQLGLDEVGIDWDKAACDTRLAADLRAVHGDVAALDPRCVGTPRGLIQSAPCTLFSQAGSGIGRRVLDLLTAGIVGLFEGSDTRQATREAIFPIAAAQREQENARRTPSKRWPDGKLHDAAAADVATSVLVLEPARWITALDDGLQWLAFEQVPSVLPLWQVYRRLLRDRGWSCWAGLLNAADYGVPQTRERAFLIARRDGVTALPPEPTHAEQEDPGALFGGDRDRWVTFAEALGVTGDVEAWARERLNDQTGTPVDLTWPARRPATTIASRGLVPHPGPNDNRFNSSTKSRNDGIRISEAEAAVLQGFPAWYPWQGTKSKVFEQIGNAVPPPLARAVLTAATSKR